MDSPDPPDRPPSPESIGAPDPLPELSRSIELVHRFHAGDRAACNELFERYRPRLIRIVRTKLGPELHRHLDEEDVVQETLLVGAAKLSGFELRSHAGILNWLARIAGNVILKKREQLFAQKRNAAREQPLPAADDTVARPLTAHGPTPSQEASQAELEALVDAAVEALEPAEYRDVILRRDYYHEEWEEVRRALGRVSVPAVQELYRRACARLQERLRRRLG